MKFAAYVLLASMSLQACVVWVPQTAPARDVLSTGSVPFARLRRVDGTRVVLMHPMVWADSVRGYAPTIRPGRTDSSAVAIALADVTSLDLQRVSKRRTAALVAGVAAGALVVTIVYAISALVQPVEYLRSATLLR